MHTRTDVYLYGYIAGMIEREAISHGKTVVTADMFEAAGARPLSGFATIHAAAQHAGVLTNDLRDRIAEIVQIITPPGDDADKATEPYLPLSLQGSWQLGYYRAMSGEPPLRAKQHGIEDMRRAAGMTQAQLADKIGCSQEHISRWETGTVTPGADTLKRIAEALGCSMDDLV